MLSDLTNTIEQSSAVNDFYSDSYMFDFLFLGPFGFVSGLFVSATHNLEVARSGLFNPRAGKVP